MKQLISNLRMATFLKSVICGCLVLATAQLQAQLLKNIQFTSAEGYSTGPLWSQPAGGTTVWAPADPNHNNGMSFWYEDKTWYQEYVTNEMLCVASDGYQGTNVSSSVTYFSMPFGIQKKGPITVTWDWRFAPTNEIPADFDPTNNAYVKGMTDPSGNPFQPLPDGTYLQETDCGFTLSDSANRMFDGDSDAVFNELSAITRFGGDHVADSRYNAIGACGGSGNWNKVGPFYQDGKWIHEKMVAYVGLEGDAAATNNTFSVWAQRDGEDIWQTAYADGSTVGWQDFGMRRCPGETDPNSGINCITMWMNDSLVKFGTRVFVDNIVVLGPIPVLSIEKAGAKLKVTFTGILLSADSVEGPWTDAATSDFMKPLTTLQIPTTAAKKFYRSVYRN